MKSTPKLKRGRLPSNARSAKPNPARATPTAHDGVDRYLRAVSYLAAAICQAAERSGAELICIGSRGRSGLKKKLLGSVTESVMRRSSRPVLVIQS